ncbi:DNA polymerase III subunit gamma and tau [Arthrobacter sp. C152]
MSARIGRVFSVTVTTALYRRYRPDSFADVIGQEHVTEPLMTALRKNRVNHAYLFSGPRGCGKTTSARILARCLNCAQGPTDTPCGTCPSCVELARGGSGSLDVIEIDAASHGGVDDARDLRERATFAPVRDRYKIFIIDEAHMVTSAGFNALLKIVEEPPEHIKFIFATTEPDKVIGTIRSRTHHYPFRLVPPEPLMAYLELLCQQENVPVAPGVLSLVIRAGGGSVRDSLSVLDQLMAGAGPNGLDYELAVALLGYTHASLLDDVVEAIAASDAATVFRAVDRVIQTGHDPRRFVEDLLERFRDLIIVQAMPESAHAILRGMPADQIARLQNQAHNLGAAELSRAADVTNTALTEMTGATSPRLHLELLCARILLPSSEQNERGMAARIDRVERRLNYAGNDVGAPAPAVQAPAPQPGQESARAGQPAAAAAETPAIETPAATPRPEASAVPREAQNAQGAAAGGPRVPLTPPRVSTTDWPVDEAAAARTTAAPERPAAPAAQPVTPAAPQASGPQDSGTQAGGTQASEQQAPRTQADGAQAGKAPSGGTPVPVQPTQGGPVSSSRPPQDGQQTQPAGSAPAAPSAMGDVEVLRRAWPDVLQTLSKIKRSTWALVEPNAQVNSYDGSVLTLSFTTQGLAGAFGRADHSENLRQAIHKTVGIDCQINAVAGGAGQPNSSGQSTGPSQSSSEPNPKVPASPVAPATSADIAWGLAPAPSITDSPAAPARTTAPEATVPEARTAASTPSREAGPAVGAQGFGQQAGGTAPSGETLAPQQSGAAPTTAASTPTGSNKAVPGNTVSGNAVSSNAAPARDGRQPQPAAASYPDAGGDYSYSDDDWGPPRDEDAPPMDEEPPMDWEPSARPGGREAAPQSPAAGGPTPSAATAHDPWTKAVEQAPGVWVVGDKSNVAAASTPAAPPSEDAPVPVPRYEPATAQVPPSIPVNTPVASSVQNAPAPEFAMASAGSAPAAAPAPAPVRPQASGGAPAAARTETRQSLYQRLSNSPEAAAGRAKAPSNVAATATAYVQDIPSADDETIEESGVFGRAAVERILGGKLIEERSLDGSPVPPRY